MKILKQHNLELEQHLRQQQKKDHDQQDSFLKKFSYIAKSRSQLKSNKTHISPIKNYRRREKTKHQNRGSSNIFSNLSDIDSGSFSSKNTNRLGIVSNNNSPILSLKQNHFENTDTVSNKEIVQLNPNVNKSDKNLQSGQTSFDVGFVEFGQHWPIKCFNGCCKNFLQNFRTRFYSH